MKGFFIIMLSLALFQAVYAQRKITDKDTLLYYINKHNGLTAIKDSADHFLVIMPADTSSGTKVYPLMEYYTKWKPKLTAYSSTQSYLMPNFQGQYVEYYKNGRKKSIKYYTNNIPVGNITLYYPNGNLYTSEFFDETGNLLLINCRDSTGNVLAQNGNGNWVRYDDDFKNIVFEGAVKDSLEEGVWYRKHNEKSSDTIVFKNGDLISSSAVSEYRPEDKQLEKIFAVVDKVASNPGFGPFLARTMRYPAFAKEHNIVGKVYVQFVVEKNGSLTDIQILKSPDQSLADEVLRIMHISPPWQPGIEQGRPVRSLYLVPIGFNLANDN